MGQTKITIMIKGENIIFISWLEWDSIPLVMHHMARRLSKCNRVLFVDPPFPLTRFIADYKERSHYQKKFNAWRKGVSRVSEDLYVYYPPPLPIFYGRLKCMDKLNQWIMVKALGKVVEQLKFETPIFWLYHPFAILPDGEFNEKLVCYDCNDDVGSFFYRFQYQRELLSAHEERLVKRADIVFTTSRKLYESKKSLNSKTYYYPSGADIELFSTVLSPSTPIASEVEFIKKPIIGFVGGITNKKIDWEWVGWLAKNRADWSIVLIGPVYGGPPTEIISLKNIHFIGAKPMEELPKYVKIFDVCLIPYKYGDFMLNCFPTKVFEFLAAGKPIVASDIPALREYGKVVRLAKNKVEFLVCIEETLREKDDEEVKRMYITEAKTHTWESRVEGTSDLIIKLLDEL